MKNHLEQPIEDNDQHILSDSAIGKNFSKVEDTANIQLDDLEATILKGGGSEAYRTLYKKHQKILLNFFKKQKVFCVICLVYKI